MSMCSRFSNAAVRYLYSDKRSYALIVVPRYDFWKMCLTCSQSSFATQQRCAVGVGEAQSPDVLAAAHTHHLPDRAGDGERRKGGVKHSTKGYTGLRPMLFCEMLHISVKGLHGAGPGALLCDAPHICSWGVWGSAPREVVGTLHIPSVQR